ncbi:MAG: DNA recombination protein RmuC [Candidatus Obscuribacterales bacterium]|nr:DNA recombination protein RmuC [Candidatus Obscuribacterales bacterium]
MEFALLLAFLVGALIGALLLWFVLRDKLKSPKSTPENEQQILLLTERVDTKETQLLQLKNGLEITQADLSDYKMKLAAAEERNTRIPDLETTVSQKEKQLLDYVDQNTKLQVKVQELETSKTELTKGFEEKLQLINEAKEKLQEAFKALSADALDVNNKTFINLANSIFEKYQISAKNDLETRQKAIDQLVKPLGDSLKDVEGKIQELEKSRIGAYEVLTNQVGQLIDTQNKLQQALRTPNTRGRWGEFQLKRVVEIAGMQEHCDFIEQDTITGDEGRLRPDMVVQLPEGKKIVVDSKVPLQAYLNAVEAQDDGSRSLHLKDHERQVRQHIQQLAAKDYASQIAPSPDFVVMFIPNDAILAAAYQEEPEIIEFAVKNKVLVATPMTLMALLHTVAYVWRQEKIAENASKISDLGRTLYNRISTLTGHFIELKKGLEKSVDAYNKVTISLETRVLTTVRKFKELGAADGKDINIIETSDAAPRQLHTLNTMTHETAEEIEVSDAEALN